MNLNYYFRRLLLSPLVLVISVTSASASVIVIDQTGSNIDNNTASGRIRDNDSTANLANWTLTSSASNTDWINRNTEGGSRGLEYTMRNTINNSSDVNSVNFSLDLLNGDYNGLRIFQTAYHNTGWNGGTGLGGVPNISSKFVISWLGGGFATISDDADQLLGFATGDTISSGTEVSFSSGQIINNVDSWGISLTSAVTDVTLAWSVTNPTQGQALYNEWVTFDPDIVFTSSNVPVPAAVWLFGSGLLGLMGVRRKTKIIA